MDKSEYNRLTAKIKLEIKKFKSSKWQNFCSNLNSLKQSDAKLWKAINTIDSSKKQPQKETCIEDNYGNLTKNGNETSTIFADYLEEIFKQTNDPSFDKTNFNRIKSKIKNLFQSNEAEILLTSSDEIKLTIKEKVGHHGAPGKDKITNKALKHLPEIYFPLITDLFNSSIKLSYVPKAWKQALVVMIPKPQKNHSKKSNHRPISLLTTLSKLLERIILTRIQKWLDESELLANIQSGFRSGRQTKDHILRIIQAGAVAFNKDQYLGAIFVDIEKAFDKVWHEGSKLKLFCKHAKLIENKFNKSV